jgi:hypothetical protein
MEVVVGSEVGRRGVVRKSSWWRWGKAGRWIGRGWSS